MECCRQKSENFKGSKMNLIGHEIRKLDNYSYRMAEMRGKGRMRFQIINNLNTDVMTEEMP